MIDRMLTVRTPNGSRSVWLGDEHPETLASYLIFELAAEREDSAA